MKKWSLRSKITFLVGLVTTFSCLLLTFNSLFSARTYYDDLVISSLSDDENDTDSPMKPLEFSGAEKTITIKPNNAVTLEGAYRLVTKQFSMQGVYVMLMIIAASLAFTYWITGRVLGPLTALTDSMKHIDDQCLDQRILLDHASGEVLQLSHSFNNMMERLENAFAVQKSFAGNAAHELKTPLAVIKTSLQVLEMDKQPGLDDYMEFAQDTRISLDRLIKTVDSLLALAHDSSEIMEEMIELNDLFKQIIQDLSCLTSQKEVFITLIGDCKPVKCEKTLLYRALYNLVENAVKYNQIGGNINIWLRDNYGRAQIKISDTGIGMEPEDLEHIFDPFFRADKSRSQKIPGSGLGMSIVKLIIERYDGSIFIESSPDKGTIVLVDF